MNIFLKDIQQRRITFAYLLSLAFLLLNRSSSFISSVREYFWGFYPLTGPLFVPFIFFFYGTFLWCLIKLFRTYRRLKLQGADPVYLSQTKLLLWGYVAAIMNASDFLPNYGVAVYPFAYCAALGWLALMAYAVFRHRLMDPKVVIQKTIIYSTVTAFLTIIYVYFVSLFSGVSKAYFGQTTLLPSATVALVVAVAFHPLFRLVQSLVDRYFMRGKVDRNRRLLELSERLASEESEEKVAELLTGFVEAGFGATSVQIERSAPEVRPLEVTLSLGSSSGWLRVGAKRSGAPYDAEEVNILRMAANQASLALGKKRLLHEFSEAFMHELKTPLSGISLPAELTLMDVQDVLNGQRPLRAVGPKILERMRYIMDQALLVGYRLEAVRLLLSAEQRAHEDTPLAQVIAKAIDSLQSLLNAHPVTVTLLPSDAAPHARCDPRQLEIVFVNLLKNAVEALEDGGLRREIRVEIAENAENIQVHVEDSGQGIAAGAESRIFQPAFSTKEERGRGMGLFLSQQIVAAHAGSLRVGAGTLGGARFTVELPKAAKKPAFLGDVQPMAAT